VRVEAAATAQSGGKARVTSRSSNPKVAKVSKAGKILAKRPGTAKVIVSAAGRTVRISIRVVKP
jgi:hypothetical protein